MAKYLDQTGLQHLLTGLRGKFVEQDKIVNDYLNKLNLKAENVAYQSGNMEGVEDVKGALDVLVANVVRQENDALAAAANMKDLSDAIDKLNGDANTAGSVAKAVKDAQDAQATIDAAQNERLETLEGLVVGGEGEGIEAIISEVAANTTAIEKLNGNADVEGSVANTVADAIDAEVTRVDQKIADDIATQAATQKTIDDAQDARIKTLEELFGDKEETEAGDILDRVATAEGDIDVLQAAIAEGGAIEKRIQANEDAIELLKGDENTAGSVAAAVKVETERATAAEQAINDEIANMKDATKDGSLAKQIADEVTARQQADNGLDQRLQAVEGAIGDGGELEKRVAANEAKLAGLKKDTVQAAIDDAQNAADSANEKIDAFLDANAVKDETINTLKEIQLYIEEHGTEAAGMVEDIAAAQKAADDEAARAKAAEAAIRQEFAAADATNLQAAKDYADAQDTEVKELIQGKLDAKVDNSTFNEFKETNTAAIAEAVKNEEDRAKGVEEGLDSRLDALETAIDGGTVTEAIETAQAAADQAQTDVDALGAIVGKAAEGEEAATGLFAAIADLQADVDQNESDCDAAIKAEKERAEAAEKANADAITAIKDGAVMDSFADVEAEFAKIIALTDGEIDEAIGAAFTDTPEAE